MYTIRHSEFYIVIAYLAYLEKNQHIYKVMLRLMS